MDVAGAERVHLELMKHLIWRGTGGVAQPDRRGWLPPAPGAAAAAQTALFLEAAGLKLESKSRVPE